MVSMCVLLSGQARSQYKFMSILWIVGQMSNASFTTGEHLFAFIQYYDMNIIIKLTLYFVSVVLVCK